MDRMGTGLAPVGKEPHQAHLVGLDGRGMSGLAQMLVQRGCVVTGSVPTPGPAAERLRRLGVRVHAGHAPRSLPRSARLLVYGPGVPREHPDRLSAASRGVEQASCPEVLGRLLRRGVGVAATAAGGRALAAAMVGWALTHAGLDPTVVLGAGVAAARRLGRLGRGPHVVVEAGGDGLEAGPPGPDDRPGPGDDGPSARSAAIRRWAEAAPPGGYVLGLAGEGDEAEVLEPDGRRWSSGSRSSRGTPGGGPTSARTGAVTGSGRSTGAGSPSRSGSRSPAAITSWGPWRRSRPAAGST